MEKTCCFMNCKEKTEFYCSCKSMIYFCALHADDHCRVGTHTIQYLYIRLDSLEKEKIVNHIGLAINSINKAINYSQNLASSLISQIRTNFQKYYEKLRTEEKDYKALMKKCCENTLEKKEFNSIWNTLNNIGLKMMLNSFEYSDIEINPTYKILNYSVEYLCQHKFEDYKADYKKKYLNDPVFTESIDFLSTIDYNNLIKAIKKSNKIIENVRLSNLNDSIYNFVDMKTNNMYFSYESSNKNDKKYDFLSDYLTTEFVTNILQINKSQNLRKTLNEDGQNPQFFNSFYDFTHKIQAVRCFTNNEVYQIFEEKLNLSYHLKLIKDYFLFEKGDIYNSVL